VSKKKRKRSRTVKSVGVKGDARVRLSRNVSETEVELLAHRGLINDYQLIAARLIYQDHIFISNQRAGQLRDYVDVSGSDGGNGTGYLSALDRMVKLGRRMKPELYRVVDLYVKMDMPCESRFIPELRSALDIASDFYTERKLDVDMV